MKNCVKMLALLMVLGLAFPLGGPAFADDATRVDSSFSASEVPAELDREAMIAELVQQWGTDDATAYQLKATLEYVDDGTLLAVWDATSLEEINTILGGGTDLEGTLALGSTTMDYVFTPVTPCRIVDTRNAVGMFAAGTSRAYYVYGTTVIANQGGNAAGCSSPVGEPRGVVVNVTAVPSTYGGNLRAYPANAALPTASLVNFRPGENIANAAAVQTYYAVGQELRIYASQPTHVVVDVMGYYSVPGATQLQSQQLISANITVGANTENCGYSPYCSTGYTLVGGGEHSNYYHMFTTLSEPAGDRWHCCMENTNSYTTDFTCRSVCARVPGR
jgi:hypothetical protein